jgi:hypothetical protein
MLLAMSEAEPLSQLHDRLDEHMRLVEDILEEIRVEVQWGIRNGRIRIVSMAADPCAQDMRINEADQPAYCPDCDTEVRSLAEAIRRGWTDLREREGGFLGRCPECATDNSELDEGDARDVKRREATKCGSRDARDPSFRERLRQGRDSLRKADHDHDERSVGCQDDQGRAPGRLF